MSGAGTVLCSTETDDTLFSESLAVEIKIALNRWCRPNESQHRADRHSTLRRPFGSGLFRRSGAATSDGQSSSDEPRDTSPAPRKRLVQSLRGPGERPNGSGPDSAPAEKSLLRRSMSSFAGGAKKQPEAATAANSRSFSDAFSGPRQPPQPVGVGAQDEPRAVPSGDGGDLPADVAGPKTQKGTEPPAPSAKEESTPAAGPDKAAMAPKVGGGIRAKERTWVYHALLAVVRAVQEEHAVPIAVYI